MVSIIVPVYNQQHFIEERLFSIFEQKYQEFEVIILDDFSSDNSWEVIKKYENHSKVSACIKTNLNSKSPFGRWKEGFELAKGDLIWIAEGDDVSDENFLLRLVPCFSDEDVIVAHTRSFVFRESQNNKVLNDWWDNLSPFIWNENFILEGKVLLNNYGRFKCPIVNVSSAIFKKDVVEDIIIPANYRYAGDWFFWGQLLKKGKVAYISEPLNYIRRHSNSATNKHKSNQWLMIIENTKIAKILNDSLSLNFEYHANYLWLLQMWKKQARLDIIQGVFYSFKYLPLSFLLKVYFK
ncbi:glycosyltransferase [Belliella sp. DSM 107340]|uniref:Glycosyltransferase n=1 Tax=Belliella calami TaxID=2923436 RepID=A0ABS9UIS6_9BACT|nr:glycosyltransferase [Belliella calami]MCH7396515.1 glycosyltransferase [Belliella calami]